MKFSCKSFSDFFALSHHNIVERRTVDQSLVPHEGLAGLAKDEHSVSLPNVVAKKY